MRALGVFGVCLLVGGGALWGIAAFKPIGAAPLRLHQWLPLPVLCSGTHCLTYRGLPIPGAQNEEQTLALLTHAAGRALVREVGRRNGHRVSQEEGEKALALVRDSVERSPELSTFVTETYGGTDAALLREGMQDLLLVQKLKAAGITDPWTHETAPRVRVLHLRYRWDSGTHQVVQR